MIKQTQDFWNDFKKVNGALSACEACFILQCASEVPEGIYLECGTAYGKSAMVAASMLPETGVYHLLEPLFKSEISETEVGEVVKKYFNGIINPYVNLSNDFIPHYEKYSYVMLDSGDHDEIVMQEVELIKDRMVSGGVIVFHDLDSQFVRVREAFNYLLNTGNYEEIKPDWEEIKKYVIENELEKDNSSWHHTELETPCFIGAVKRK